MKPWKLQELRFKAGGSCTAIGMNRCLDPPQLFIWAFSPPWGPCDGQRGRDVSYDFSDCAFSGPTSKLRS